MEFGHGTRIIFWYDADASFADSVDNLQLEDVISFGGYSALFKRILR